jgi:MarR-like DNA-binding transcriptional regulator SgrR of sgrS sRNA
VKVHNGKELTSADVVPSLVRWGKMSTPGKALWESVEAVEAKGPYEVAIHLKEPNNSLLYGLAHFGFRLAPPSDLDTAIAEVERAGGKLLSRGRHPSGAPFAYVADPDGYIIEL